MKKNKVITLLLFIFFLLPTVTKAQSKKYDLVVINTIYGKIELILYKKTPKHSANFLKLVNNKFYDSTLFHRVINNFMIQGGDPTSKNATITKPLGSGDNGYKIPAEILPELFHQKGALAAARDNNPEKASSGCQFYLVHGKIWNDAELAQQIKKSGRTFSEIQKNTYKTIGGAPHLDGNYTVFGQVVSGLAIIDSIAKVPTLEMNRPKLNILMAMKSSKIRKKKILKKYGFEIVD